MSGHGKRPYTKDEIFEILIRKHVGGELADAIMAVIGRYPTDDDYGEFERMVSLMHSGWVSMNGNIRKLGTKKP